MSLELFTVLKRRPIRNDPGHNMLTLLSVEGANIPPTARFVPKDCFHLTDAQLNCDPEALTANRPFIDPNDCVRQLGRSLEEESCVHIYGNRCDAVMRTTEEHPTEV